VLLPTPVPTVSSPVPPVESPDHPAPSQFEISDMSTLIRQKVLASDTVSAIPSPVDGQTSPPAASPSDLDNPIALRKGKWSCTDHPISNFVSYDHINPIFR